MYFSNYFLLFFFLFFTDLIFSTSTTFNLIATIPLANTTHPNAIAIKYSMLLSKIDLPV